MSDTAIQIENLSKYYRLGLIGGSTLRDDLNRWWAKVRNHPDPLLPIDARTTPNRKGSQIWALRHINLVVRRGEVLGIIGFNGAGKSTLLKILSRVTAPTEGRVLIKGRIASLLEVGTGMHPELTGLENIYLNGAILGMNRAEIKRQLDEIIYFCDLEEFIFTPVKRYSSGMRVRLGFAVAAHLQSEIMIVDEVLAVGDAAFQRKCIKKMQDISSHGRTILFVSHNMGSIKNLCSKAILLNNGEKQLDGNVDHVVQAYLQENEEQSSFSLAERRVRKGNGLARLDSIEILSTVSGTFLNNVIPGMDVTFRIGYDFFPENATTSCFEFALSIYRSNGDFVTVLNNVMAGFEIKAYKKKNYVFCRIKNFPLMPGLYQVRAMIRLDNQIADLVENAIKINVVTGDFYKSGKPNDYGRQGVYLDQSWDV